MESRGISLPKSLECLWPNLFVFHKNPAKTCKNLVMLKSPVHFFKKVKCPSDGIRKRGMFKWLMPDVPKLMHIVTYCTSIVSVIRQEFQDQTVALF